MDVGSRGSRRDAVGGVSLGGLEADHDPPSVWLQGGGGQGQLGAIENGFPVGCDPLRISQVGNGNAPIPRTRCEVLSPHLALVDARGIK